MKKYLLVLLSSRGIADKRKCFKITETLEKIADQSGKSGFKLYLRHHSTEFYRIFEDKTVLDVYDACSLMVVTALSETSIASGNMPVQFPDFTRGKYKTRKTVDVLDLPSVKE